MTTATLPANRTNHVPATNPASAFRAQSTKIAQSLLTEWVGEDRAREATGRIAAALSASAASARDPNEFYQCTPQSVATCIAVSALTEIMPGVGSTALAYVLPQRARKGEPPQLQYSLSHRGLNALARRCGQTMVAIPVGNNDQLQSSADGDVELLSRDIDNPPLTHDQLRGVIVVVKEITSGVVLYRGWMPKVMIEQRRKMSRSFTSQYSQYSPWTTWPIEMAMKTAMHYAISRGWCVIDDTSATRAMSVDVESDLARLPAPSGPGNVSDLAALINGDGGSQSSEPTNEQEPDEPPTGDPVDGGLDLSFLDGETAADWGKRTLHVIQAATSVDGLTAINAELDRLLGAGEINQKRHGEMVSALNAQASQISA